MLKFVRRFRQQDEGAVTVDWVVLTAAVVGLAIAAYGSIRDGAADMTANTGAFLGAQTVGAADFGTQAAGN
mgnify:CR=1 FL=1